MSNTSFGISDPLVAAFVNSRVANHVSARSDLAAILAKYRHDGGQCVVKNNREVWIYDLASTDPAATGLVIVPNDIAAEAAYIANPTSVAGRWVLANSQSAVGLAGTWKQPVRAASTTNLVATRTANVLLADANGALGTMDGVTLAAGDRVLLKNQTTGADNGIYVVTSLGGASAKFKFTRATDMDTTAKTATGSRIPVTEGAKHVGQVFVLNTTSITLNTTALVFQNMTLPQATRYVRGVVTSSIADLTAFTVASDDGLTYAEGDRLLYVNSAAGTAQGIYVVGKVTTGTAALTLTGDWRSGSVQPGGVEVVVNEGTTFGGTRWFATLAGPITVGVSSPAFYPRQYTVTPSALAGTPGVRAVSNLWLLHATRSTVQLTRRAAAGTLGHLSMETLTAGAGTGSFTITSSGNETSTVDATIINRA